MRSNLSSPNVSSLSAVVFIVLAAPAIGRADEGAQRKPPAATETTPETFVDALNFTFGKQTTQRATHAKGVVLVGRFTPTSAAQTMSKAPHFKRPVPVTVRFSDNTGIPKLPDAAPLATPHGLAIKFHLPDGTETDLVTHSFNGFPTATPDDQRRFFIAVGMSGAGVPSPTPLETFMKDHPTAKAFLTGQDPPPVSYATTTYFGVNSFKFTNAAGKSTFARYQLIPLAGRHFLTKDESAKAPPDYLSNEVRARVGRGAIKFKVVLQLAEPGDKIDDPSVAWADTNKLIEVGTLAINANVPDTEATDRGLLFLPGVLPLGIEPADAMIQFRSKTYPVSYERRQKGEGAIQAKR